jgi:hypothetical protein
MPTLLQLGRVSAAFLLEFDRIFNDIQEVKAYCFPFFNFDKASFGATPKLPEDWKQSFGSDLMIQSLFETPGQCFNSTQATKTDSSKRWTNSLT